jgi:glycosyltransferase involved in cell wall biosynthesis
MYTLIPAAGARRPPRKVIFIGLRGIPQVQGGVETHVAALSARMAQRGWEVEVLGRKPYLPSWKPFVWKGVTVTPLWSPRSRGLEALLHTALSVVVAALRSPDVVHIQAIGPALLTPLARLLGLKVVVTHHGFDYERQKWGWFAKTVLRAGEAIGMKFSHANIGVSKTITDKIRRKLGVGAAFIPNGIETDVPKSGGSSVDFLQGMSGRYILAVGRIVEEKRQLDLINAFARLNDPDTKLIIVGKADHESSYMREVEQAAAATPGVILAGFQYGAALAELYERAALFVLPSSHEGMPIVLLEALSNGIPCLASDIDANLALDLGTENYFSLGDIDGLAEAMKQKLATPDTAHCQARAIRIKDSYGWNPIVDRTISIYEDAIAVWKPRNARRRGTGVAKRLEFGGR